MKTRKKSSRNAVSQSLISVSALLILAAVPIISKAEAIKPKSAMNKISFPIRLVTAEGIGKEIGTVEVSDSNKGLSIVTDLRDLPAGSHGFHLHEKGSCEPGEKDGKMAAAIGAGGHYDPDLKKIHEGPMGNGHKGDMPVLEVAADGTAKETLLAPHLKVSDTIGRAFMIHQGGDNFSDTPAPLGGGAGRIACGVVVKK